MEKLALTPKQSAFIDAYMIDRNSANAARKAGYSEKTARSQGQRLLTNVDIAREIDRRTKMISEEHNITAETIIKELAKGAFAELPIEDMKWADKLKCLEIISRYLGLLDGIGAKKGDTGSNKNTILDAIKRIGIGTPGNSKPSDSH